MKIQAQDKFTLPFLNNFNKKSQKSSESFIASTAAVHIISCNLLIIQSVLILNGNKESFKFVHQIQIYYAFYSSTIRAYVSHDPT